MGTRPVLLVCATTADDGVCTTIHTSFAAGLLVGTRSRCKGWNCVRGKDTGAIDFFIHYTASIPQSL